MASPNTLRLQAERDRDAYKAKGRWFWRSTLSGTYMKPETELRKRLEHADMLDRKKARQAKKL